MAARELTGSPSPTLCGGAAGARIDRLQDDVRHTLQLASVIGKSFLYRLLEAIAEAEQQLEGQLAQLQRVDLVREKCCLPELEILLNFPHARGGLQFTAGGTTARISSPGRRSPGESVC